MSGAAVDRAALGVALGAALGRPVRALRPVPGGDLNEAFLAEGDGGARCFVKSARDARPGAYAAEAAGLRWLADAGALPVPAVLAVGEPDGQGPPFLALEWVDPGRARPSTAERLGRGLAALHAAGAPSFGSGSPQLLLGPLALPDAPAPDWPTFLLERRLAPLVRLAVARGALDPAATALLERLAERLPELAGPPEPPARLHGDLWVGNVHVDRDGAPWLVDPAAHGGHREVDLAMLRLFGSGYGPGSAFRAAYEERAPLAAGAEDRVALWQLAPLLVHAALFGGGYGDRALATLRRYAA